MSEQSKILFTETQYIAPRWVLPALAGIIAITNIAVVLFFNCIDCKNHSPDLLFLIISPFVPLLFHFIRLDTEIDEEGIRIYFAPFVRRKILFSEISKLYIRKYRPIVEYGGWGIKGWKKSNCAYNIKGNIGLQLELKNSSRVLIGTQKPEELAEILKGLNPPG